MPKKNKKKNIDHLIKKYKEIEDESPSPDKRKSKIVSNKIITKKNKSDYQSLQAKYIRKDLFFTVNVIVIFAIIIVALYFIDRSTGFVQVWAENFMNSLV